MWNGVRLHLFDYLCGNCYFYMKRLFSLLLFSLAPLLASAQWEFGLDFGASVSHTNRGNETYFDMKNAVSFLPEFRASYNFASNWYLGLGASHVTKCYKLEPADLWTGKDPGTCRFRYFSLPVMLTYRFPISEWWIGFTYGIQGDLFMSQKTPTLHYNGEDHLRYELDNKEMNTGFEMLLGTEFGYQFHENWKAIFSYRYAFDMVKVDERDFHGKFRSNIFLLGVRYLFSGAETVIPYDAVAEY